jgi:hypothetical protein
MKIKQCPHLTVDVQQKVTDIKGVKTLREWKLSKRRAFRKFNTSGKISTRCLDSTHYQTSYRQADPRKQSKVKTSHWPHYGTWKSRVPPLRLETRCFDLLCLQLCLRLRSHSLLLRNQCHFQNKIYSNTTNKLADWRLPMIRGLQPQMTPKERSCVYSHVWRI